MSLRRLLLLVGGIGVCGAMLLGSAGHTQAGTSDPEQAVEDLLAEINAGDVDGALALLSDDFVVTSMGDGSFMSVGKPAFGFILEQIVAVNAQGEFASIESDDNTVTATVEWTDDDTEAAGVDRYVEEVTFTVTDDGLVSRIDTEYDTSDAQTQDYLEYLDAQEGDDEEELPPGAAVVTLAAQPGGNQPGEAVIFEEAEAAGLTFVFLGIAAGAAGAAQPAHFHTGTCAAPGPIVEPLASVVDGESFTILSTPMDELVDAGLIINVHLSTTQLTTYVSCGVVASAAAPAPTAPAGGAAPTATAPTGVRAPDTGTGSDAGGTSVPTWAYAALAAGAAALGAGALRARRSR
jgi:hypothetical protein